MSKTLTIQMVEKTVLHEGDTYISLEIFDDDGMYVDDPISRIPAFQKLSAESLLKIDHRDFLISILSVIVPNCCFLAETMEDVIEENREISINGKIYDASRFGKEIRYILDNS